MDSCSPTSAPILHPAGPVALAERDLLFTAVLIMLIVVLPVFVMAASFAWRYRAAGGSGRYTPNWYYSAKLDAIVWLVPAAIIVVLGILLWKETHALDPYRPLHGDARAVRVEVIAQDWKWLFIYPDQDIATVNELVFPAGRPLSLRITSDTVMNAFFIPALGGQIYAMAGMQTRLQLLADRPGCFRGRNMQYSGDGFPDQHFTAHSLSAAEFRNWMRRVKQSPTRLDQSAYEALASPSIEPHVSYYSGVAPGLFNRVIAKYAGGHAE